MLHQSGGLFDISKLASELGISRATVKSYLEAMTIAHAVFPLQPFHGGGRREMIRRPKIYAFDTGFITFVRGWESLREEDRGGLWEHLVLDTLRSAGMGDKVHYWRDKSDHEIDFILPSKRSHVDTLECKIDPNRLDEKNLMAFRKIYPQGLNWLVSPKIDKPSTRRFKDLEIHFISTRHILEGQLG